MLIFFSIFFNFLFSNSPYESCIIHFDNRDIERQEYVEPQQLQSDHFVIHFTVSDSDYQLINNELISLQSNFSFAQSILDLAEISITKYINDGWELPPPDCDESISDINSPNHCSNFGGNSLYDIYISNDGVGMVVPETLYPVEPYTGGYTSYMKISTMLNAYDSLPTWAHHVVAHELHHSIQIRYGYSTSGSPGNYIHNLWFFEQSASYMENVIFPYANHVQIMLSNCNVVTPLTHPEHGIDYPSEIYPYRSALWQKFLVESLGDSSIIKIMWEDYGLQYATGNPVSLFPIYDSAIREVSDNNYFLAQAYNDYSIWRYFTGDRTINNQYFHEASDYCTSTTFSIDDSFSMYSEKGGAYFIDLPSENINLIFSSNLNNSLQLSYLSINANNDISILDLPIFNNNSYYNFDFLDLESHVLIVNTDYNGSAGEELEFSISINDSILLGDINFDNAVNVIDVVMLVNFILFIIHPTDLEFSVSDINNDSYLDVIDVVLLINDIL